MEPAKMKVLLLNPPAEGGQTRDGRCQTEGAAWLAAFPPVAFAGIAGCVREKYALRVMDCVGSNTGYADAADAAIKYSPHYLVVNTSTPTVASDLAIAGSIRDATGAKIIAYGENVTARHEDILRQGSVDYAVLGEPETPVMRILEGNPKVAGVATEGWDGGNWWEPDLDALPMPAYDLLPPYRFPLTGERWMFLRVARGCPYRCVFCVEPTISSRPRTHSVDYLMRQFKWLIDGLGIRVFMFGSDTATLDRQGMLDMCRRMTAEKIDKKCKWFCTTRVDRFDLELARKMHEAGCRMISFGLESGSQEVLDLNLKGITLQQSRDAVEAARRNGIVTIGHFIIGLMGDNPKRARQTAKFARDLNLDFAQFYVATPYPGSEFRRIAEKNGWIAEKDQSRIQQGIATISYPDFSPEEMQRERRSAFLRFYLRPRAIYSSLKTRTPSNMMLLPLQAARFSKWALR